MKAYRYRIEPDEKQVEFLAKQFGCCRFVYNWALDLKTKAWQTERKGISVFEISRQMTLLK
ncbi:MAG: helix-turn-helix domain-containing protein, partial [Nitrospirae bacterium]|nr:helix-turn-helix domain-containing protein [Nitrospirota bacterium]